jgi:hypothetical protein
VKLQSSFVFLLTSSFSLLLTPPLPKVLPLNQQMIHSPQNFLPDDIPVHAKTSKNVNAVYQIHRDNNVSFCTSIANNKKNKR